MSHSQDGNDSSIKNLLEMPSEMLSIKQFIETSFPSKEILSSISLEDGTFRYYRDALLVFFNKYNTLVYQLLILGSLYIQYAILT